MQSSIQAKQRKEKEAYWRPHMVAWQTGRLSIAKYCKQNDLSEYQFRYWQEVLAPQTKRRFSIAPVSDFIEVTLAEPAVQAPVSSPALPSELTIETAFGFSIHVNQPIDLATLKPLLVLLKELA